jgi:hypothetical protein
MGTAPNPAVQAAQQTLEQKIDQAALQAGQVASIFSPAIGIAIQEGVAVEPVISGFVHLLLALFKHHTKASPAPQSK